MCGSFILKSVFMNGPCLNGQEPQDAVALATTARQGPEGTDTTTGAAVVIV